MKKIPLDIPVCFGFVFALSDMRFQYAGQISMLNLNDAVAEGDDVTVWIVERDIGAFNIQNYEKNIFLQLEESIIPSLMRSQ